MMHSTKATDGGDDNDDNLSVEDDPNVVKR